MANHVYIPYAQPSNLIKGMLFNKYSLNVFADCIFKDKKFIFGGVATYTKGGSDYTITTPVYVSETDSITDEDLTLIKLYSIEQTLCSLIAEKDILSNNFDFINIFCSNFENRNRIIRYVFQNDKMRKHIYKNVYMFGGDKDKNDPRMNILLSYIKDNSEYHEIWDIYNTLEKTLVTKLIKGLLLEINHSIVTFWFAPPQYTMAEINEYMQVFENYNREKINKFDARNLINLGNFLCEHLNMFEFK